MDREPATPTDLHRATQPGDSSGERNGADADHPAATPFEHGTDAQIIQRVRTATPLITPTPGPGASSTLRREVLYALRTGGPASPDQVADRVGASRTGVLQQLRTLETAGLVTRS